MIKIYCLRYLTENQRIHFFSLSTWPDLQKFCPKLLPVISFHTKTVTSLQHIQTSSLHTDSHPPTLFTRLILDSKRIPPYNLHSPSQCCPSVPVWIPPATSCTVRSSGAGLLMIARFRLSSVVVLSLCDTSIYHNENSFFIVLSWLSFFST